MKINNRVYIYQSKKKFIVLYNNFFFISVSKFIFCNVASNKVNNYFILMYKLLQFGCISELGKDNEYF